MGMKKILLMFAAILGIFFFTCNFLYVFPNGIGYDIYKVTKIGLSYTGADTPEVEILLSQTFDFQIGTSPANYASDKVMYLGDIPDGTITGIWVYITEVYEYDVNGTLLDHYSTAVWFDCRTGFGEVRTNLSIAVSEGERAKIIIDYTGSGFVDTKEAL